MLQTLLTFLEFYAFALIFELPILLLAMRGRAPMPRVALAGALANLPTHGVLWFLGYRQILSPFSVMFIGGPLAVLFEAAALWRLLRPVDWRRATLAVLLANLAGIAMVGLFQYALINLGARDLVARWAISFTFTLVVEMPLYALLAGAKIDTRRALLAAFVCTAVTHPLLIFVWRGLFTDYNAYIVSGELLVAVIESLIFYAIARPIQFFHAVSVAFFANASSYFWGHMLRTFLRQLL
ncbi:MAG TPA: hypothetical protein PKW95_23205 [bacterium]|nr:hypothetical protein [bacterium]